MPNRSLSVEQVLTILAETLPRIAALTAGLIPDQLHDTPHDGEWSVNEVLAHLRACADMWSDGMMAFITQDRPTIRAVNPRTWIKSTDYPEQKFQSSLRVFTTQRKDLLTVLEPLAPEGWSRAGTVTGAGKPLVRTVLFYAQWMADHERTHTKQIERIVNSMCM